MIEKNLKIMGITINANNLSTASYIFAFIGLLALGVAISFGLTWFVAWAVVSLFGIPVIVTWKTALGVYLILITIKWVIRGAIDNSNAAK